MRRLVLTLIASGAGLVVASGCVSKDGGHAGEAPLWYPAFVVRDANTTQQWGGQDIYGQQTNRVDRTKQPSIGSPDSQQPVNPPDTLAVPAGGPQAGMRSNWNDPSQFYVAGQQRPMTSTSAQQPYGEGLRPPGSATVYPTRGNAAQSVGSPTLYPPTGTFRTDGPSLYPNGATGERGFTGK
jgi:hypothetical protein